MKNHTKTPENPAIELLTVAEAARLLRVSGQCVYHMVWRGEMPHVRVASRILIHRAVIDGMLAKGYPRPVGRPARSKTQAPAKTLTA
jgi:excisionase family DNA binding protein